MPFHLNVHAEPSVAQTSRLCPRGRDGGATRVIGCALVLGASLLGVPHWLGCSSVDKQDLDAPARLADKGAGDAGDIEMLPTPRIHPMTHLAAGRMLERQGSLEAAVEQYERAIAANPRFTTAYSRLGIVHQKLGRFEDADYVFKQGIRANPGSAMLWNNLGYSHLMQDRLPEAEKAFREALVTSPEFKRARGNLAVTLARAGRTEESLVEFSRVVPADAAHYNLGVICLGLADYETAEESFRQALTINPACPGAKELLERVSRLAAGPPEGLHGCGTEHDVSLAGHVGEEADGAHP